MLTYFFGFYKKCLSEDRLKMLAISATALNSLSLYQRTSSYFVEVTLPRLQCILPLVFLVIRLSSFGGRTNFQVLDQTVMVKSRAVDVGFLP
jgi:hypothetical protein